MVKDSQKRTKVKGASVPQRNIIPPHRLRKPADNNSPNMRAKPRSTTSFGGRTFYFISGDIKRLKPRVIYNDVFGSNKK